MQDSPFADTPAALAEVLDLFAEVYLLTGAVPHWRFVLLEHWYYSHRAWLLREKPGLWRDCGRVWRDDAGKLVAFLAAASSGDPLFVVSHPAHRDVEEAVFEYVDEVWLPRRGKATVVVTTGDEPREGILRRRGFVRGEEEEERHYRWDLTSMDLSYSLPDGFVVRGMGEAGDEDGDYTRQADLTRRIFPRSEYTREAHDCLRQAPDYRPDLDVAAIAPSGEHVALACAMLDPRAMIGDFEPIGADPRYRRLGLGRAVVLEALRRLRDLGARQAFVVTGGEPYHANAFYRALGPVESWTGHGWTKVNSQTSA
jgi:predicted N-acetyltransferase YhbS